MKTQKQPKKLKKQSMVKFHHKLILLGVLTGSLLLGGLATKHTSVVSPVPTSSAIPSPTTQCDATLWNHIYNPQRLHVIDNCKTVTGIIEVIRHEADGDQHILVKLDKPFLSMVNQVNIDKQKGDLVIEPICFSTPTQQDTLDQGVCN